MVTKRKEVHENANEEKRMRKKPMMLQKLQKGYEDEQPRVGYIDGATVIVKM